LADCQDRIDDDQWASGRDAASGKAARFVCRLMAARWDARLPSLVVFVVPGREGRSLETFVR
jgi:hypothetical protein